MSLEDTNIAHIMDDVKRENTDHRRQLHRTRAEETRSINKRGMKKGVFKERTTRTRRTNKSQRSCTTTSRSTSRLLAIYRGREKDDQRVYRSIPLLQQSASIHTQQIDKRGTQQTCHTMQPQQLKWLRHLEKITHHLRSRRKGSTITNTIKSTEAYMEQRNSTTIYNSWVGGRQERIK
eukprot:5236182-Amphidinium_carterae.1